MMILGLVHTDAISKLIQRAFMLEVHRAETGGENQSSRGIELVSPGLVPTTGSINPANKAQWTRSITTVNRSVCERFLLFIRRRVRGLRHLGSCLTSSMSSSWTAVIQHRIFRAFTSCASSHRSSAIQLWSASGGELVSVVVSGLKFIKQRPERPKPWNPGSVASSDAATEYEARRPK